jgi:hypothetical protein
MVISICSKYGFKGGEAVGVSNLNAYSNTETKLMSLIVEGGNPFAYRITKVKCFGS